MLIKRLIAMFFVVLAAVTCLGQDPTTLDLRPKAVVAGDRHEFQSVPEGTQIEHEFVIQNEGDGPLSIESVAQSCTCLTILSYDKTIAPHARGTISIRLDTAGYGGKNMERNLIVTTNERERPNLKLTVAGKVETVYTVTPKVAKLEGSTGERIDASITVIPEPKYPFKVLATQAKSGDHIQVRLEEIVWEGRPAFRLHIENKRKEAGRYFDSIFLTTDSQVASTIRIGVFGHIKEAG